MCPDWWPYCTGKCVEVEHDIHNGVIDATDGDNAFGEAFDEEEETSAKSRAAKAAKTASAAPPRHYTLVEIDAMLHSIDLLSTPLPGSRKSRQVRTRAHARPACRRRRRRRWHWHWHWHCWPLPVCRCVRRCLSLLSALRGVLAAHAFRMRTSLLTQGGRLVCLACNAAVLGFAATWQAAAQAKKALSGKASAPTRAKPAAAAAYAPIRPGSRISAPVDGWSTVGRGGGRSGHQQAAPTPSAYAHAQRSMPRAAASQRPRPRAAGPSSQRGGGGGGGGGGMREKKGGGGHGSGGHLAWDDDYDYDYYPTASNAAAKQQQHKSYAAEQLGRAKSPRASPSASPALERRGAPSWQLPDTFMQATQHAASTSTSTFTFNAPKPSNTAQHQRNQAAAGPFPKPGAAVKKKLQPQAAATKPKPNPKDAYASLPAGWQHRAGYAGNPYGTASSLAYAYDSDEADLLAATGRGAGPATGGGDDGMDEETQQLVRTQGWDVQFRDLILDVLGSMDRFSWDILADNWKAGITAEDAFLIALETSLEFRDEDEEHGNHGDAFRPVYDGEHQQGASSADGDRLAELQVAPPGMLAMLAMLTALVVPHVSTFFFSLRASCSGLTCVRACVRACVRPRFPAL